MRILNNSFFFLFLKIKQITLNVASEHDKRQEGCNHSKTVLQNLLACLFWKFFYPFHDWRCIHKLSLGTQNKSQHIQGGRDLRKSLIHVSA